MKTPLRLSHRQQTTGGRCLTACARMVLEWLTVHRTEDQLAELMGTSSIGTPAFAVKRLESLGVQVIYGACTLAGLLSSLDAGLPVIVFVRTGLLGYWKEDVAHAVVLAAAEPGRQAWVYDPALDHGPVSIPWHELIAAWAEFDYRCATMTK